LPSEDANAHLQNFLELCNTVVIKDVAQNSIRLRLFPFSLAGKAKQWFYQNKEVVDTWEKCSAAFLAKFFPMSRTSTLRGKISNFQQKKKKKKINGVHTEHTRLPDAGFKQSREQSRATARSPTTISLPPHAARADPAKAQPRTEARRPAGVGVASPAGGLLLARPRFRIGSRGGWATWCLLLVVIAPSRSTRRR
jgi:hypothetical protein